jgi:hypothetical protein
MFPVAAKVDPVPVEAARDRATVERLGASPAGPFDEGDGGR